MSHKKTHRRLIISIISSLLLTSFQSMSYAETSITSDADSLAVGVGSLLGLGAVLGVGLFGHGNDHGNSNPLPGPEQTCGPVVLSSNANYLSNPNKTPVYTTYNLPKTPVNPEGVTNGQIVILNSCSEPQSFTFTPSQDDQAKTSTNSYKAFNLKADACANVPGHGVCVLPFTYRWPTSVNEQPQTLQYQIKGSKEGTDTHYFYPVEQKFNQFASPALVSAEAHSLVGRISSSQTYLINGLPIISVYSKGLGNYKSTDLGKSWTKYGLQDIEFFNIEGIPLNWVSTSTSGTSMLGLTYPFETRIYSGTFIPKAKPFALIDYETTYYYFQNDESNSHISACGMSSDQTKHIYYIVSNGTVLGDSVKWDDPCHTSCTFSDDKYQYNGSTEGGVYRYDLKTGVREIFATDYIFTSIKKHPNGDLYAIAARKNKQNQADGNVILYSNDNDGGSVWTTFVDVPETAAAILIYGDKIIFGTKTGKVYSADPSQKNRKAPVDISHHFGLNNINDPITNILSTPNNIHVVTESAGVFSNNVNQKASSYIHSDLGLVDTSITGIVTRDNSNHHANSRSMPLPISMIASTASLGTFISKDNGANWQLFNAGLQSSTTATLFKDRNMQSIYLGMNNNGGVYKLPIEGGNSWVKLNYFDGLTATAIGDYFPHENQQKHNIIVAANLVNTPQKIDTHLSQNDGTKWSNIAGVPGELAVSALSYAVDLGVGADMFGASDTKGIWKLAKNKGVYDWILDGAPTLHITSFSNDNDVIFAGTLGHGVYVRNPAPSKKNDGDNWIEFNTEQTSDKTFTIVYESDCMPSVIGGIDTLSNKEMSAVVISDTTSPQWIPIDPTYTTTPHVIADGACNITNGQINYAELFVGSATKGISSVYVPNKWIHKSSITQKTN